MAPKAQPTDYSASSITVLEGLEAVRKRPGMYIGSTGERGLHHLVQEVVDNAVDEALAGYCDTIVVTLLADGGVRVIDNGRGIPVDLHPSREAPAVEVALTMLHAGGKFDGKAYAVSGGLHGVGVSVVNALSTRMTVEIQKDGFTWRQDYLNSKPGPLEKGGADAQARHARSRSGPTRRSSRRSTYSTSRRIYRRLQEMAFLNRGLTITLRDERRRGDAAREVTFCTRAASPTSSATSTRPRRRSTSRWSSSAPRATAWPSRSRCSGTSPTASRSTPSPTRSTRTRAAPTRRASGPR